MVVLAKGVNGDPEQTLDRVVTAMRECGMRARVR